MIKIQHIKMHDLAKRVYRQKYTILDTNIRKKKTDSR